MRSLTSEQVTAIRTVMRPDAQYAREWKVTTGTVRDARTGRSWPNHLTPPDPIPRGPGRPFMRIKSNATEVARALEAWRAPDNGEAKQ